MKIIHAAAFALLATLASPVQAANWQCGPDYIVGSVGYGLIYRGQTGPHHDPEDVSLWQMPPPGAPDDTPVQKDYRWKGGKLYFRGNPCIERAGNWVDVLKTLPRPDARPCDIAQDYPDERKLNPEGGNADRLGPCLGVRDGEFSLANWWGAHNCGYAAYRENKPVSANPYRNEDLKEGWTTGWERARKACAVAHPTR
jgi:hypothetical protein